MESSRLTKECETELIGHKRKLPLNFSQERATKSLRTEPMRSPGERKELVVDEQMYIECCLDGYFRTLRNPDIASYALIVGDEAHFYTPPLTEKYQPQKMPSNGEDITDFGKWFFQIPRYTILRNLYEVGHDDENPHYMGLTDDGLRLYGVNSLELTLNAPEFNAPIPAKMVSFYPLEPWQKEPYWGERAKLNSLFFFPHCDGPKPSSINNKERVQEERIKKKLEQAGITIKAIRTLPIDLESVCERKKIKRRNPDQNTVMRRSAVDESKRFLQSEFAPYLVKDVRDFLEKSASAPLRGKGSMWLGQWRDEWLHLAGFGLMPLSLDPQIKENLGAASKCVNTEQMIVEYILQGLARLGWEKLGYTNSDIPLKIQDSYFEMIPTTDIISYMSYHTRLELSATRRSVETHQEFSPLQPPPFRHKADVGAGCVIFSKFLEGHRPCHTTRIQKRPYNTNRIGQK